MTYYFIGMCAWLLLIIIWRIRKPYDFKVGRNQKTDDVVIITILLTLFWPIGFIIVFFYWMFNPK